MTEKVMPIFLQSQFPVELPMQFLVSGSWRVKNVRMFHKHTHTHTDIYIFDVKEVEVWVCYTKLFTHYHRHTLAEWRFIGLPGLYSHQINSQGVSQLHTNLCKSCTENTHAQHSYTNRTLKNPTTTQSHCCHKKSFIFESQAVHKFLHMAYNQQMYVK